MSPKLSKRILFFAHDSGLYGASLSLLTLLENISSDKSFEILVFLPYRGLLEERLNSLQIEYKIVGFPKCVSKKTNSFKYKIKKALNYYRKQTKILPEILSIAISFNPDLIYTNTSAISIGFLIAKRLGIPHIWHIREYGDYDYDYDYLPYRRKVKKLVNKSDKVIFVSKLLQRHWGCSEKENCTVIYNGVDIGSTKLPLISCSYFKFGLLGSIMPNKGQDIAIKAFYSLLKHNSNCELHFYGDVNDQNYKNNLLMMIEVFGIKEKVIFHPFESDNNSIYQKINILLSCSSCEAFGRTIIEAMVRGIPVIANAQGGPLEIIDDCLNGLLYNGTIEDLAKKMVLLVSDSVLFSEISKNGTIKAQKDFSSEKYTNSIKSSIIQMVENRN